jgi:hypothetical protein
MVKEVFDELKKCDMLTKEIHSVQDGQTTVSEFKNITVEICKELVGLHDKISNDTQLLNNYTNPRNNY